MTNLNDEVRDNTAEVQPPANEAPTEVQPEAPNEAPNEQPKVLTFTQEEFEQKIIGAKRQVKNQFADYDELKQKAEQLEAAERERREAEMSELERYQAQLAEKDEAVKSASQQLEEYKAQVEREKIQNAFTNAAVGADVAYIDDALRLADLSGVKVEDGKVIGVDEIVADLVKSKPFLLRATPQPIGNATQHQEPKAEKTAEQQLEELRDIAKKSGKHSDMAAYISFKRQAGL